MKALTSIEIVFNTMETEIVIPKGALITVDPLEDIGYYQGRHFHCEAGEYIIVDNL